MRALGLLAVAAAALAVVQVVAPSVRAQVDVQTDEDGTLVQIGPDAGVEVEVETDGDRAGRLRNRLQQRRLRQPGFVEAPVAVSRYWIGIGGEPVPAEVRAQVEVPAGQGVLIRTVAEESPAAEAGVQPFDIVLRANGKPIATVADLADHVGEQGERQGRITLELLRKGQPKTLWVKPIQRPAEAVAAAPPRRQRLGLFGPNGRFGGQGLEGLDLEGLLGGGGLQLGQEGLGGFAEMIPEMVGGGGVSVSVSRQNEGPAQVTVQQGDQTWQFDEGDQDAIDALPDSVRPMVQGMLNQNGRVVGEDFEGFGIGGPGFQLQFGDDLAERMRAMQERMRTMQGQFGGAAGGPAVAQPQIELDEAPAFGAEPKPAEAEEPEVVEPIEIEIPAGEE